MDGMNYEPYQQKLTRRRRCVARTLEYVRSELAVVDKNRKLIDEAAYKSRCELLDGLVAWYLDKLHALIRHSLGLERAVTGAALGAINRSIRCGSKRTLAFLSAPAAKLKRECLQLKSHRGDKVLVSIEQ